MLNGYFGLFRSMFRGHSAMMLLCIAAMVGIFAIFSGGVGEAGWLSLLLPLGACLLMHFFMHGAMGHGTHSPREHHGNSASRRQLIKNTPSKRSADPAD